MNSDQKGRLAESVACFYLRLKGYKILSTRYKTKMGEVDIIARKSDTIAFIEVKKRPSTDDGLYAVHPRAMTRIKRAAEHYLIHHQKTAQNLQPRFDVIAIAAYHQIKHINNAF